MSPAATHLQVIQLLNQARYHEATVLSQTALHRYETRFGPSSLEAALMLHDLAKAHRATGQLTKAESAARREIEILRTRLGEDDPSVALALDTLAEILFDQSRLTEATRTLREALRIVETQLDPYNPHLATILNDLGAVYYRDGRPAEAATLLHRALTIRELSDPSHAPITRANIHVNSRSLTAKRFTEPPPTSPATP